MPLESAQELLLDKRAAAARVRDRLPDELLDAAGNDRRQMVFDVEMHLAFLGESLRLEAPRLFAEYASWTSQLLTTAGGDVADVVRCFDAMEHELRESGTGGWVDDAAATLQVAREQVRGRVPVTQSHLRDDNVHRDAASAFLAACLRLRRTQALAIVHDLVAQGATVQEIYLDVLTPVMHELGRKWHLNHITVGQEHYCTAVAQMVMAQLFPLVFDAEREPIGRVVAVCVAGEVHEIGARMVADFFEMEGWDTYFLGANTPVDSILQTVADRNADILALSATMTFHVEIVKEIIDSLRQKGAGKTRVLVGGYPFNLSEGLWQRVGADGFAPDAEGALLAARQIMA